MTAGHMTIDSGIRARRSRETENLPLHAWIQQSNDGPVLILSGAAVAADRIPDLVAMLNGIHAAHLAR